MSLVLFYDVHTYITNIYRVFITNVIYKNWLHNITNDNKYTIRQHVQPVNLCSHDTASRDHAFPSGILATHTTVSKTPRGRCVHKVKRPYCVYFQPLNGTWKHICWLSLRYNWYNLCRITWFCNTNKKPRMDHVALTITLYWNLTPKVTLEIGVKWLEQWGDCISRNNVLYLIEGKQSGWP